MGKPAPKAAGSRPGTNKSLPQPVTSSRRTTCAVVSAVVAVVLAYSLNSSNRWKQPQADRFRVWIDFQGFRYANQADVYASALAALGGHLTGGPPWAADGQFAPHDRGVSNLAAWDLHISSYGPYGVATPGQLVNRLPGTVAIKFKTYLAPALVEAYGVEAAFKIMPLTFQLPLQQEQWWQWLDANPQQDTGIWVLKNNLQQGEGIRIARTPDALEASKETHLHPKTKQPQPVWQLAQQYITKPFLIQGRKIGLRVFVVIPPGTEPLRAYIHKQGLVNFGTAPYDVANVQEGAAGGGKLPAGHVTDVALSRGEALTRWSFKMLKEHIADGDAWKALWDRMAKSAALVVASSLKHLQAELSDIRLLTPRSFFELYGVDFVLDENLYPWLAEFNSCPSMGWNPEDKSESMQRSISIRKAVVHDMFLLAGVTVRDFWRQEPQAPVLSHEEVAAELQRRGGFVPLMHLFPHSTDKHLQASVPWTAADKELQAWIARSHLYQQVLADCMP